LAGAVNQADIDNLKAMSSGLGIVSKIKFSLTFYA
jgi:hypothetical protein